MLLPFGALESFNSGGVAALGGIGDQREFLRKGPSASDHLLPFTSDRGGGLELAELLDSPRLQRGVRRRDPCDFMHRGVLWRARY